MKIITKTKQGLKCLHNKVTEQQYAPCVLAAAKTTAEETFLMLKQGPVTSVLVGTQRSTI